MKRKRLFKFYFAAEELERALNIKMENYAYRAAERYKGADYYAEKILLITEEKDELSDLWNYMDGVMQRLSKEEREALRRFGLLRTGLGKEPESEIKLIRRAAVKFQRGARRLERFERALKLVDFYAGLY